MLNRNNFNRQKRQTQHGELIMETCRQKATGKSTPKESARARGIAAKMRLDEPSISRPGSPLLTISGNRDDEYIITNGKLEKANGNHEAHRPKAGYVGTTVELCRHCGNVLSHHEHCRHGYPNGLRGEAIPLEARIIAVADSYDAMTHERTYKKAMEDEAAVLELRRCSGTQFDPCIVDLFIHIISNQMKGP